MDPGKIFQIITNSTLLATRLLSEPGRGFVEFSQSRYCTVVSEATPISGDVIAVSAIHSKNGPIVRYSITDGNREGIFKIDETTGVISLSAPLDFERRVQHDLVVSAETADGVSGSAHVQVMVEDVNDSPPIFLKGNPVVTVIEEDDRHLPAIIAKVTATDLDALDKDGLIYRVEGDGIDGYPPEEVFFTINTETGDLIQLKALDRDPPEGRGVWKLTVEATDGQATKSRQEEERNLIDRSEKNYNINSSIWPEEIVTRGNTIWKETSANKRNAQGLLRDDAAIRNAGERYISERQQKVNSYTNPDEKRLNRKPAEQKKAWEHRQKRHNPYHKTDSQKLIKTDKNQDADMVGEKNEPKDKTNQRFFRKITSWKEIDPDIRADCENEKPYSIWEKIDTNRHQKKNAPKKERERQVWKPHDNERYPWIYREEDNQNSRSSHEKKYRYRNPKGPGVWNNQKRLEIGGNFDGNLKRGNEWVGKSVKAQGTPIRRQTKQRKKRDTLQQEKKHLVRTTQKWGEHNPVTLTTRKSLPGQEFGLGNYILNGRAPRGPSGQESRRLLESRLRRLSTRETQRAFGQDWGKSLRHLLANSLHDLMEEGEEADGQGDYDVGDEDDEGKDHDDFYDDDDDDFGWDTSKGDDGRDDGTDNADDYEEYDDGSYNETDLEDYDGGGNATVDYDADDLGDYVGGSDGDAEDYHGDDIVNYNDDDTNDYEDYGEDGDYEGNDDAHDRRDYSRGGNEGTDETIGKVSKTKVFEQDENEELKGSSFLGVKSGKLQNEEGWNKGDPFIIKSDKTQKRTEHQKNKNLTNKGEGRGDTGNIRNSPNSKKSFKEIEVQVDKHKKRESDPHEIHLNHNKNIGAKWQKRYEDEKTINRRESNEGDSNNLALTWKGKKVMEKKLLRSIVDDRSDRERLTGGENKKTDFVYNFSWTQDLGRAHSVRHSDLKRVNKRRVIVNRKHKGKGGDTKFPWEPQLLEDSVKDDSKPARAVAHHRNGRQIRGKIGESRFRTTQSLVQNVLNLQGGNPGNKNIDLYKIPKKTEEHYKSPREGQQREGSFNKNEKNLDGNYSLSSKTQRGIKLRHHDSSLQSTALKKPHSFSKATGTNVTFHLPSIKSSLKEKKKKEITTHTPLREETSMNLNLKGPNSSTGSKHYPNFNSSWATNPYFPKTSRGHTAEGGTTSSAGKDEEKPPKERNKTKYLNLRTLRRRELRHEEENGCSKAKMNNDYGRGIKSGLYHGYDQGRVHKVTTTVTIIVKDINDNAPIFPENVMMGEVRENGQLGVSVARISAWDADDSTEGLNGRVTYSIEKNVIDEETGRAIFNVDQETGVIRTALCCLDRETTPEYQVQVVATDGGGLKGTGTVVIRIGDENDNSPEFPSERFELEVDETWGNGDPDPVTPLMEVTCFDPDVRNDFLYRIIQGSGWGWDYFDMRSEGRVGQLFARRPLDYENPSHRRELAFKLQVTDKGEEGWADPTHVDTAWVKVQIKDVNDNAPAFDTTHAQISIMENAPKGTKLATFHAHDPDKGGNGVIDYKITDLEDILEIDDKGVVRIKTESLDRETLKEDAPVVRITGVDRGQPPLTSTATLSLSVMDVNDSPPYLLPPTVFHIPEGAPPTRLGLLKAYDDDSWALGNGPPFNISFASTNPDYVREIVDLQFSNKLDSGRGAATLWTRKPVDREKHHQLDVRVTLTDARGLTNEQTVTVVVDDVNDNPMKPGKKTIYLYKIQGRGGSMNVPLGRVYVDDPDDWDLKDKTFKWATSAHPLFTLDQQEGTIYVSSQVREGRYLLEFSVSDRVSRQKAVSANVTVVVKSLEYRTLLNAAPISLFPASPAKITKDWNPVEGGGILGKLLEGILAIVGKDEHTPEVVSVYGNRDNDHKDSRHQKTEASSFSSLSVRHHLYGHESLASSSSLDSRYSGPSAPVVSVWLTVRNRTGGDFMNPVKLKGLLSLHRHQLEESTGLNVTIEGMENIYLGLRNKYRHQTHRTMKHRKKTPAKTQDSHLFKDASEPSTERESDNGRNMGRENVVSGNKDFYTARYKADASGGPSTMASVSSTVIHLQVIDTNNTSLVTPRLKHFYDCKSPSISQPRQEQACLPGSCLNGGRCVQFSDGKRCICPGGSVGFNCKVLSRSFMGSGWSWLPSIPPCFPSTMSLKILTQQKEALLLYSGPIEIEEERLPFMAIQLSDGYPELVTNSWAGRAKLKVDTRVNDGSWHTIHIKLDHGGVSMVTDACGQGWSHQNNDTHCAARALWTHPDRLGSWVVSSPLQVGGLAQDGDYRNHGWDVRPITQPLHGCVSHITINGELLDLGEPPLSQGSTPGCQRQEVTCVGDANDCSLQEMCQNKPQEPLCICKSGSMGSECQQPTVPATLGPASYYKVALSFTPSRYMLTLQIRMKAQGQPQGLLIHVADSHVQHSLSVQLHAGKACLEESRNGERLQIVCIEGFLIGDNNWHLLRAERYGHNLKISVDDGDGLLQNESFPSLVTHVDEEWVKEMPVPLEVNRNDGVTIGGMPEYTGTKLLAVHNDLQGVCIDDLRISGHQIPIPPGVNNSKWGQVTTQEGLLHGCVLPDICQNFSCKAPLTCNPTWPEPTCSCGYGLQYVGNSCRDINECLWSPCLNGGSCHNLHPGYFCQCDRWFLGANCQFRKWDTMGRTLTAQALIATVTVSLLVIVLLGLIFSIRRHCQRSQRSLQSQDKDQMRNNGDAATVIKVLNGEKPGRGRGQVSAANVKTPATDAAEEVEVVILKENPPHDPHLEFMERLRLSHQASSLVDKEGKGCSTSTVSQTSAPIDSTSNCSPRDQKHRRHLKSGHQLKGAELSLSEGVHIATLSGGSNPG